MVGGCWMLDWSFGSFVSIPTNILCCYFGNLLMKFAKYIIILSHISVASRFCSSSRCHCCIMLVKCPIFLIEDWQVRYPNIIVRFLLSLPVMVMYDHLPSTWGSLPEVVIPELSGWSVMIAVPPGWYTLLHSVNVSEDVRCEYRQCCLLVTFRDASPGGCFSGYLSRQIRIYRFIIVLCYSTLVPVCGYYNLFLNCFILKEDSWMIVVFLIGDEVVKR